MILYLSAKTKIPDLSIDFIEVILENGREISLNWDETDIKRENGEITARYKGVYFGEEYANGKIAELEDFSISYIGIYSETEGPFDISIDEMVFEDGNLQLTCEDVYFSSDIMSSNEYWEKLKLFAYRWIEQYNYELLDIFNASSYDDTSELYDVFYDMKSDIQKSSLNLCSNSENDFDNWYDELATIMIPILKNIAYEKRYGGVVNA